MFSKQNILLGLFWVSFIFFPFQVKAEVIINEVGWLGTPESSYNEWVELYNDGSEEVDLNNWALYERDELGAETRIIKLTQKIAPQGYYLIVRVTASAPNPFSDADEIGSFSGGGILNTGENIILKDSNGNERDSVLALGLWKSSTRDGRTMQRNGEDWIMAMGTPKAQNTTEAISTESKDNSNDSSLGSSNDSNLSAHSGQMEAGNYKSDKIEIGAGRARLTNIMTPVEFKVESKNILSGNFEWSFGDGTSGHGAKVSHKYEFPGRYNVVLNYSSGSEEAVSRTTVTVTKSNFELSIFPEEGYLTVKNLGDWEENINDWTIYNGRAPIFTFAKDTIVSAGDELKIALPKNFKSESWSLNSPDGFVVTDFKNKESLERSALSASVTDNETKVAELRQGLAKAQSLLAQIQREQRGQAQPPVDGKPEDSTKDQPKLTLPDKQEAKSLVSAELFSKATNSDTIIIDKKEGVVTKILKTFKKIF